MKNYRLKTWTILLFAALFFTACQKDEVPGPQNQDILPENFKVDIPDALSYQESLLKGAMIDTLKGNEVYCHLGTFIWVGESAAEIVEDIIRALATPTLMGQAQPALAFKPASLCTDEVFALDEDTLRAVRDDAFAGLAPR